MVLIQTLGRGLWETQERTRGADPAIIPTSSLRGPRHLLLSPGRGHWAHRSGTLEQRTFSSAAAVPVPRGDSARGTEKTLPAHPRPRAPSKGSRVPQRVPPQAAEVPSQNQQAGQLGLSGSSSALWGPCLAIWDSGHLPAEGGWAPPGNSTRGMFGARLDSGWDCRAGPLCRPMSHASEWSRGPESRTPWPGTLTHTPSDPSRHLLCPFLIMGF